jgi:ATPase subunit of ABC transporter with duplicated ATPase domains
MITATGVELRAGAQLLIGDVSIRVGKGDRVGLVGRNGAGKTTFTKALAGEAVPAHGYRRIPATGSAFGGPRGAGP